MQRHLNDCLICSDLFDLEVDLQFLRKLELRLLRAHECDRLLRLLRLLLALSIESEMSYWSPVADIELYLLVVLLLVSPPEIWLVEALEALVPELIVLEVCVARDVRKIYRTNDERPLGRSSVGHTVLRGFLRRVAHEGPVQGDFRCR